MVIFTNFIPHKTIPFNDKDTLWIKKLIAKTNNQEKLGINSCNKCSLYTS